MLVASDTKVLTYIGRNPVFSKGHLKGGSGGNKRNRPAAFGCFGPAAIQWAYSAPLGPHYPPKGLWPQCYARLTKR